MKKSLLKLVITRAHNSCEYCLLPVIAELTESYQVDHVIPTKHQGITHESNLAYSCPACNRHKGTNIAGRDPDRTTIELIRLFHHRIDLWKDHFQFEGDLIIGTTDIGRVTVQVLCMNRSMYRVIRQEMIEEGLYPPPHYKQP